MRQRKAVQTTMESPVLARLTDEQVLWKAQELAARVRYVKLLRRKKREDMRAANEQIDAELDAIEVLAESIDAQQELRKQGELKFGEEETSMSRHAATEALAQVYHAQDGKQDLPPGAPPLADDTATEEEPETEPKHESSEDAPDTKRDDDDENDDDDDDDDERPADEEPTRTASGRTSAPARRASSTARGPIQRASSRKTAPRAKGRGRR